LRQLEAALNGLDIGRTAQCASLIAPYALAEVRRTGGLVSFAPLAEDALMQAL
jgi:hypothetical protein